MEREVGPLELQLGLVGIGDREQLQALFDVKADAAVGQHLYIHTIVILI